jgi:hypothetical protein
MTPAFVPDAGARETVRTPETTWRRVILGGVLTAVVIEAALVATLLVANGR